MHNDSVHDTLSNTVVVDNYLQEVIRFSKSLLTYVPLLFLISFIPSRLTLNIALKSIRNHAQSVTSWVTSTKQISISRVFAIPTTAKSCSVMREQFYWRFAKRATSSATINRYEVEEDPFKWFHCQFFVFVQNRLWASLDVSAEDQIFVYPCPSGYCQCTVSSITGENSCIYNYDSADPDNQCSCQRSGKKQEACWPDKIPKCWWNLERNGIFMQPRVNHQNTAFYVWRIKYVCLTIFLNYELHLMQKLLLIIDVDLDVELWTILNYKYD